MPILTGIVGFHLLALLACIPWLFSWSGLAWAVAGLYLFGTLGINIGYHRLLTHRGFACPRWLERTLTILGVCCWQGSPMSWVAIHRMHHQHSDDATDPHTPKANFFWSHMGWFLIYDPSIWSIETYDRYARDLLRDWDFQQPAGGADGTRAAKDSAAPPWMLAGINLALVRAARSMSTTARPTPVPSMTSGAPLSGSSAKRAPVSATIWG